MNSLDSISGRVLKVRGLTVDYHSGGKVFHAVRGIDFEVPSGEVVALVGESGSGKSTVSASLIRRLPVGGKQVSGEILFRDLNLSTAKERVLRQVRGGRIGFVPQDPSNSLNPLMKVGEQIAEALRLHRGLDKQAAAERAVQILDEVGIAQPAARAMQYPHELSGGMRQRVLIGIAWSCEPELVIADEPTSALDVTVQRQVLDRMERLAAEHNTAVLLVTHDLAVAADRASRVLVMHQGKIVESGTSAEVLSNPQHEYTRRLVAAAPGLNSGRITASVACSSADSVAAAAGASVGAASSILRVENLSKTYTLAGGVALRAVDDVSFDLLRGQTLSIVGESGSGKTTTARIAARIIGADSGRVFFDGQDVTAAKGEQLRQLRRRVQVVYQNPFGSLDPLMSLGRIIAEPLRAFGVGNRASQRQAAAQLLDKVQLPADFVSRRPAQLSGGQRQRVAIARALALTPDLILLDEPVSALDVSVQEQILQLLVDLQAEFGLSYLFISHDLGAVRQISDQVVVMQTGRVVEAGQAEELLSAPREEYTRELLRAVPGAVASTGL
ncbi:dipeptide ABC transporter ATP-binding protein [Psychromicrobium xiongbiense]|uniref:dipeptide ABC transporter ATP-binding protein n=1 Tax=Psychromicrobium xiongbiense TaxID=3051184 RepID=UPI002554E207|nr:ABC transporter ATP-binding protein [Psychromicrobium sp. YIM S02556]